jgi:hypothetical protein
MGPAPVLAIRRERIALQRGAAGLTEEGRIRAVELMQKLLGRNTPQTAEVEEYEIGATPFLAGLLSRDDEVEIYVDRRGRPTFVARRAGELLLAIGDLRPSLPLGQKWALLGDIAEPPGGDASVILGGPGMSIRAKRGSVARVADYEVKLHWCSEAMKGGRDFCLTMSKHGSASAEALDALVAAFKPLPASQEGLPR